MSTLRTLVNHPDITPAMRNRYSTALPGTSVIPFVQWANDLLEELQERGFLPSLIKERGIPFEKDKWLAKPSDFIELLKIYNPDDEQEEFRVEDVEGKFKMMDWEYDEEETGDQITSAAFGTYLTTGLFCTDLISTTYTEDYFENYLFWITAGTSANTGMVIYENDAAINPGGTKLVFMHALSSALSGTKVTAARLVPPDYYAMIKYRAIITAVSILDDEMPFENDCENRLVPAWMRWKSERATMATSKETVFWKNEVDEVLYNLQAARLSRMVTPVHGRRLPGFERDLSGRYAKAHPDYEDFV